MTDSMKSKNSIAAQLAALPNLPMHELWALWDQYFPRRPMRVVRRHLEARIAYRLQEKALGGLPADVKTYLADCGEKTLQDQIGERAGGAPVARHHLDP